MSRFQVWAWKCDREGCGHVWLSVTDEKPTACAKCKCRNWHEIEGEEKFEAAMQAILRSKPMPMKELIKKHKAEKSKTKPKS